MEPDFGRPAKAKVPDSGGEKTEDSSCSFVFLTSNPVYLYQARKSLTFCSGTVNCLMMSWLLGSADAETAQFEPRYNVRLNKEVYEEKSFHERP